MIQRAQKFLGFLLAGSCACLFVARAAQALETQVSVGVLYFPGDPQKIERAETESAEDGLVFHAPRDPRDVAQEYADEEIRGGNVCLRQLRRDLKASLREWRVRSLCEKLYQDQLEQALRDAGKERLHPDHVECSANAEVREEDGTLKVELAFRAQLVMRDRAPPKLRRAGIGGELTRWDLPAQEDVLGEAAGSWKEALKGGACSADGRSLDRFWKRVQGRAAEARELAECLNAHARESATLARLQKELTDYVPEEWVKDRAGDESGQLLQPLPSLDRTASLAQCKDGRAALEQRLGKVRSLSEKIADKYEVPALRPERTGGRSPASESEGD